MKNVLWMALLASVLSKGALAAEFPTHPVTLVVPLAAGSTADILARAMQPGLSKALGQTVVVENRPGAGGQLAMSYVAKQAADGYTIVMGSNGTWAINLGLYEKLPYRPVEDFAPVAYLAGGSNILIVKPSSPYTSVAALIAAMKAAPGKLTYSSGGNGTTHHLSSELLKSLTDTQAMHIPYGGAPQGVSAVMAGETDFGFYNTPSVSSLVKERKLRALAATGTIRTPMLPEVPTMMEAGVDGYVMSVDFGLLAPAGTPEDVILKLNQAANAAMAQPKLQETLKNYGFEVFEQGTPGDMAKRVKADIDKWVPIVRQAKAKVD